MTGEDLIIQTVAELLRGAKYDEYLDIRKAFWIAGRCEHCAAPHTCDGTDTCASCRRPIVNRSGALPTVVIEAKR